MKSDRQALFENASIPRAYFALTVPSVLVSACLIQAAGNARGALALSLSRQGVVFLGVIVIANALLGYSGVIAAQAVADLLSAAIAIALVRKYVWHRL